MNKQNALFLIVIFSALAACGERSERGLQTGANSKDPTSTASRQPSESRDRSDRPVTNAQSSQPVHQPPMQGGHPDGSGSKAEVAATPEELNKAAKQEGDDKPGDFSGKRQVTKGQAGTALQ
jgi:hypothetical protein